MASGNSAQRRLAYILSDETYGPKLARLRGLEERRILNLIGENRGNEARKAILEADEQRRERNRENRAARQTGRQRVSSREEKERLAVANILHVYGRKADTKHVRRNVGYMSPKELDFSGDASEDELTDRAVRPADRKDSRGTDINPFWYH